MANCLIHFIQGWNKIILWFWPTGKYFSFHDNTIDFVYIFLPGMINEQQLQLFLKGNKGLWPQITWWKLVRTQIREVLEKILKYMFNLYFSPVFNIFKQIFTGTCQFIFPDHRSWHSKLWRGEGGRGPQRWNKIESFN